MAEAAINPPAPWRVTFDRAAQVKAAVVAAAFVAVFWHLLDFVPQDGFGLLVHKWLNEPDWSHGPIVPLISIWLVGVHWDWYRGQPVRHAWLGLPVILLGLAGYEWFTLKFPVGYYRDLTMLVTLAGVVILLCGAVVMKRAWLPLAYLLFAIPLPKGVYFSLTDPLRRMAATVATGVLTLVPELEIDRNGSMIEYNYLGRTGLIGVADACSGMRSTITLCALGVAVAFLQPRPWWQRLIMLAACVPIAVFSNFIRVTITCILHIFVNEKYAHGTWHTVLGLVTLMIAFGIFSGLGWLLSNLVVEEDDAEAAGPAARA